MKMVLKHEIDDEVIRAKARKLLEDSDSLDWEFDGEDWSYDTRIIRDKIAEDLMDEYDVHQDFALTKDTLIDIEMIVDGEYYEMRPDIAKDIESANQEAIDDERDYRAMQGWPV